MTVDEDPIYLDHNATTPVLPEVLEAMLPYLREHFGNPSSGHIYGRRARRAVDTARRQVAKLLGASTAEIVFTSGGTEANNLAIQGVCGAAEAGRRKVVSSVIEHPATAKPCARLSEVASMTWVRLGVDKGGRIGLEQAREAIDESTALVTVMHSNNETGVIQPIGELAKMAHDAGALIHTDGAQAVGKIDVDVKALAVDLLSVAGHKVYAPKGVGVLYIRQGVNLEPTIVGAGHEGGRRPGTENVAAIVGLGKACEIAGRDQRENQERIANLRDDLWQRLAAEIPGLKLNGHREHRLPNTLNIRFPKVTGQVLLAHAPEVAASTASACHGGSASASAVIVAMGVAPEEARGSVRLSLGRCTTGDDVAQAAKALVRAWKAAGASP